MENLITFLLGGIDLILLASIARRVIAIRRLIPHIRPDPFEQNDPMKRWLDAGRMVIERKKE